MEILIIVLLILCLLLSAAIAFKVFSNSGAQPDNSEKTISKITESNSLLRQEINQNIQSSVKSLGDVISSGQTTYQQTQTSRIEDLDRNIDSKLKTLETRFATLEQNNEQKLEAMRQTISKHLTSIQEDNNRKLESIQKTVDEKLENKMNESFKLVSERLEQVYKGLGEMQSIASGVGDLKKVLSNVKSRGILGEIQLGAILSEILAPEQYETDIAVIPKSTNRVEFAVKLPGGDENSTVYLPIDSKFPGDTYAALQDVDLNESACNDLIGILDKLDAELNGSTTKKDLQSHQQALLKIANVTTSNISVSATLDANTGIGSAKIVVMAPGQDVPSQENATTTVTVAIGQGIINQTGVDTTATVAVIGGVALISLLGVGAFIASRSKKVAR